MMIPVPPSSNNSGGGGGGSGGGGGGSTSGGGVGVGGGGSAPSPMQSLISVADTILPVPSSPRSHGGSPPGTTGSNVPQLSRTPSRGSQHSPSSSGSATSRRSSGNGANMNNGRHGSAGSADLNAATPPEGVNSSTATSCGGSGVGGATSASASLGNA